MKSIAIVSVLILFLSLFLSVAFISFNENATNGELIWSVGKPFPTTDGQKIYPPLGPYPLASTEAPHWYAGSYCTWSTNHTARSIGVTATIPYSQPRSDEFYYVLLSAWDNAGSYDQIGFSDYYGTWGLVYSWTTGPANDLTFHYTANALALSLGATYTFSITTQSGVTSFAAYQSSSQIWSLNAPTGGDNLVLSTTYGGSLNYANYEEIWYTSATDGSPAFDFHFSQNNWESTDGQTNPTTAWTNYFYKSPSNVAVTISSSDVIVNNPTGTVLYETNPDLPDATVTFDGSTYTSGQTQVFSSDNYNVAATAPSGYRFDHWECNGNSAEGVYVLNSGQSASTVQVNGDGFVKAIFTLSPTPTPTLIPTATPSPTPSPSPTPIPTLTPTPTPTDSPTPSPTPSPSPSPSPSPTPSQSPTPNPTINPTQTPSPTPRPSPTPTASPTPSPNPTPTISPTPSPTPTPTLTPTPTSTSASSTTPTPTSNVNPIAPTTSPTPSSTPKTSTPTPNPTIITTPTSTITNETASGTPLVLVGVAVAIIVAATFAGLLVFNFFRKRPKIQ